MSTPLRHGQEDDRSGLSLAPAKATPHLRPRLADCPFCGKAEGDDCPACGGVNATAGADKKRRAREEAERARTERSAPGSTTTAAPCTSATVGSLSQRTGENP